MPDPTPPIPGAEMNAMLLLGLPDRPLDAEGYFTLLGKQAVTFTGAKPVTLEPGDKLYRVFGGKAAAKGGFWAPEAPAPGTTEGAWRASNAVVPAWNDGTEVEALTVKEDAALQCWTGTIESQPAMDKQGVVLPDWWLVGGGTQFFVQFWTPAFTEAVTLDTVGPTPWDAPPAPFAQAYVAPVATAADLDPGDPVQAHVVEVLALAEALRAMAAALSDAEGARMSAAADTVLTTGNTILENQGRDDAMVAVAVRSHLDLGRHIEPDPAWPASGAVDRAVTRVVGSAAALSSRAG
ncbi:hypothetical protein [Citreimonas sp.]|uniref:hypothetical protein n=1 Tax=Citreimonas sp. TaxID=3036715 RepID=UPI004059CDF9